MESILLPPTYTLSKTSDLKGELCRLKLLTEALTACISNDKALIYKYLHQLTILPKEQQFKLVRFSGISHDNYEEEFESFAEAMKFLVLSIRRIEAYLEREEEED